MDNTGRMMFLQQKALRCASYNEAGKKILSKWRRWMVRFVTFFIIFTNVSIKWIAFIAAHKPLMLAITGTIIAVYIVGFALTCYYEDWTFTRKIWAQMAHQRHICRKQDYKDLFCTYGVIVTIYTIGYALFNWPDFCRTVELLANEPASVWQNIISFAQGLFLQFINAYRSFL